VSRHTSVTIIFGLSGPQQGNVDACVGSSRGLCGQDSTCSCLSHNHHFL
jgi:hypothetical protein